MYINDFYAPDGIWASKMQTKGRGYCPKTLKIKSAIATRYIIPFWGGLRPADITVKEIEEKLSGAKSDIGIPLSGSTKGRILNCLSDIFIYLIAEGAAKENPVRMVTPYVRNPVKPRGALSKKEMDKLFPRNRTALLHIWGRDIHLIAFLILRDTGLRPGELIALKWGDWHPDLAFFPVTKAVESGTRCKLKETKTGMIKPALVTKLTESEINRYIKEQKPDGNSFIFSGSSGTPVSIHKLERVFKKAVIRAGINRPEISPYWLRHTFNTRALEDLPDEAVRKLMGHSTSAMTRYYRDADIDSLIAETKRIRQLVKK